MPFGSSGPPYQIQITQAQKWSKSSLYWCPFFNVPTGNRLYRILINCKQTNCFSFSWFLWRHDLIIMQLSIKDNPEELIVLKFVVLVIQYIWFVLKRQERKERQLTWHQLAQEHSYICGICDRAFRAQISLYKSHVHLRDRSRNIIIIND